MEKLDRIIIHSNSNISINKSVTIIKKDGKFLDSPEHFSYFIDSISLKIPYLQNMEELSFIKDYLAFDPKTLQYDKKIEYHISIPYFEEDDLMVSSNNIIIMIKEEKLAKKYFSFLTKLVSDNVYNADDLITDNYKV